MHDSNGSLNVSRRALLRVSAGTAAFSAVGTGLVSADGGTGGSRDWFDRRCPDATLEPSMGHCAGASTDGCDDDHPETVELQTAVRASLEERYPDAGALVEAGYKPYFDTLDRDADGWSHWINPDYVGDDTVMDPDRPESVLVDNESWRSIGVMFVATRGGESLESPPAVYDEGDADDGDDVGSDGGTDHEGHSGHDDHENHGSDDHEGHGSDDRCSPWHYHAGLPGRFAWWYYRQAYEQDFADGDLQLPCRTPCMMHVWSVDHPEGVYAHDGPPAAYREQEPADDPGFETDAKPGSDELGWDVLPDDLVPEQRPEDLAALIPGL
ncbi:hypothetical protein GS429_16485 [Natronorubrum sp. JWXQ-INN-674]|uniref:Uncharacterized protein n=1 Tax=Natronorubrum halalkaliphilum TaxID=2691917 RepID=A0A6B0VRC3_9EURY|nr:hypothetical protein [Natronorubrum halalkaliphilum]MXV63627.1 hypothetical protein [Natronorubrum halalkaliphilum]